MEDRYWFYHRTVGHTGPFRLEELRAKVAADPSLRDGEASRENDDDAQWRPVAEVLGGLPPAADPTTAPPTSTVEPGLLPFLRELRGATAYTALRGMVTALAVIGLVVVVGTTVSGLVTLERLRDRTLGWAIFGQGVLEVLAILVAAGALRALLDIADCALHRERTRR